MADLRFNCTERYKKQIKKQAVDKGVSVSQLLSEVVLSAIPADDDFIDLDEIRKELDEVRNDLIYNSSSMSQEERNSLKLRKEELKNLPPDVYKSIQQSIDKLETHQIALNPFGAFKDNLKEVRKLEKTLYCKMINLL